MVWGERLMAPQIPPPRRDRLGLRASEIPDDDTALVADAERSDGRESLRDPLADWGYQKPVPRHLRFELEDGARKKGFDYFWAALKIGGMPNPRLGEYWRAGWRPARAEDYPKLAGLDLKVDPRMVELGYMNIPKGGDPIIDGDLMFCLRPEQLSRESRRQDKAEADSALYDRTEALRAQSVRAIGARTRMDRKFTQGIPPDQVPDDMGV
jgi:hypothetical protein